MSDYSSVSITAVLFIFVLPICSGAEPDRVKALSGPEILQKMEQSSKLAHPVTPYTEVRRYSLRNERFKRESEMHVRATHSDRGTTRFEVLNVIGSEDIYRRVFTKLLEGETQLSRRPTTETALTSANYEIELRGTEALKGRTCYVLELIPRRSSKYLLQGRAWIDVTSLAVVKIEGRPTASLSFWVGKPLIIREFEQVEGTWFMVRSNTTSSTRFFGTSELSIDHRDRKRLPEPRKAPMHGPFEQGPLLIDQRDGYFNNAAL